LENGESAVQLAIDWGRNWVITFMKWFYLADLLRTLANEDNIIALWKKWYWTLYVAYLGHGLHECWLDRWRNQQVRNDWQGVCYKFWKCQWR
jgi:hypothetical protein